MRIFFIGFVVLLSFRCWADVDFDRAQTEQRIKPLGRVHLKESSPPISETKSSLPIKENRGQRIYEQYCVVCHRDGIAGAPKFRDKSDWQPRLSQKSIESLTATATKGLNAMPAKGTCQECNDKDIQSAIEYMVPTS